MATIAITGSAGGIGHATAALLEKDGHRVIGVDVRDADVEADLSTPEGRLAMIAGVTEHSDGTLDGVVAGAGIMSDTLAVSVNYFGAIATLEGLRPLLSRSPNASAIAISSNSTTTAPGLGTDVVEACLAGDEARAVALAPAGNAQAYALSKLALAALGSSQRGDARLDRRRHPAERDLPRVVPAGRRRDRSRETRSGPIASSSRTPRTRSSSAPTAPRCSCCSSCATRRTASRSASTAASAAG